jgi:hypothetical protein
MHWVPHPSHRDGWDIRAKLETGGHRVPGLSYALDCLRSIEFADTSQKQDYLSMALALN